MKKLGPLAYLESDISLIFGGHAPADLGFLSDVGEKIERQTETRTSMEAALSHETGLEPEKADVLKYFRALGKKSNNDVIAAYTSYAQGFFQHRGVSKPERSQC